MDVNTIIFNREWKNDHSIYLYPDGDSYSAFGKSAARAHDYIPAELFKKYSWDSHGYSAVHGIPLEDVILIFRDEMMLVNDDYIQITL